MRTLAIWVLMLGCLVAPLHAEEVGSKKKFWWSVAALGAASFLDVHSSYGKFESNAVARSSNGRLGMKGVGIKFATFGALLGFESMVSKRYPDFVGKATVANFALAGAWTAVAVRNYGIAKPASSPARAIPAHLQ